MHYDIYCVVTENCNLRCNHCYLSASPRKEHTTISPDNFKKLIDNLPHLNIQMCLTGGEIFSVRENLWKYLEILRTTNIKRSGFGVPRIEHNIQTNGFWLKEKEAETTLHHLKFYDVRQLDLTSNDEYHLEQGLRLTDEEIDLARDFFPNLSFRGVIRVAPFGRAKEKSFSENSGLSESCAGSLGKFTRNIKIRPDGKVYPCCYGMFPLPGNIFEESLQEIVENARENKVLSALSDWGLLGTLHETKKELEGIPSEKEFSEMIRLYGPCGACSRIYGNTIYDSENKNIKNLTSL